MKRIVGILLILITAGSVRDLLAQDSIAIVQETVLGRNNLPSRADTLAVQGRGPFLIRPFLISNSLKVRIDSVRVGVSEYDLDALNGLITFNNREIELTSVLEIEYTYIPIGLASSYRAWPMRTVDREVSNPS